MSPLAALDGFLFVPRRWLLQAWRRLVGRCPCCGGRLERWPVGFADWVDRCFDCSFRRYV